MKRTVRQPKRETAICGLCDETYYMDDAERVKVHEHPEPQSGDYRGRWLASRLSYERWIVETKEGRAWVEYQKRLQAPKKSKPVKPAPELRSLADVIDEIKAAFDIEGVSGVYGFAINLRTPKSRLRMEWGDIRPHR